MKMIIYDNKTNDNSTPLTLNPGEPVNFKAASNQSVDKWSWYKNDTNQNNNYDNFSTSWATPGTYTIKVNATSSNGMSNTITWTVNVTFFQVPASKNLVQNPDFEMGTTAPFNWSLVTNNGNTPVWDNVSHGGSRSIRISIPGANDSKSGYLRSDLVKAEPLGYYNFSAWVKTDGTGGTNTPAVRVVELDSNMNRLQQTNLIFGEGTNIWMQKRIDFQKYSLLSA